MANFEISNEYTEQIRKFETKDPAHADLFNAVIGTLLNNDVFLKAAIDAAYRQGTGYTDQQIANLIDGAPETLDTLREIAEAMQNSSDVVEVLDAAISTKASQAEVDGHIGNGAIHITATERQNWSDKQTKTGDAKDNIVTFESGDATAPTGWADVSVVATKEKLSSLMRKFSLVVKNMRYIFKLIGSTQLSVGDGTVTGAISALNTSLAGKAASSHSHDDRYYTETEIDAKLIKIKAITLTTAYSSANASNANTSHGLGSRVVGAVAWVSGSGGIRAFPYYLDVVTNTSIVQVTAFSSSQWTTSNSNITVSVLLFYI